MALITVTLPAGFADDLLVVKDDDGNVLVRIDSLGNLRVSSLTVGSAAVVLSDDGTVTAGGDVQFGGALGRQSGPVALTGSRSGGAASGSIAAALQQLGLALDHTTP